MSRKHKNVLRSFLVLAIFVVPGLAACKTDHRATYQSAHQITVSGEKVAILITIPSNGSPLLVRDRTRFSLFVHDYANRGRGQVLVEISPGTRGGGWARQRVSQVRNFLISSGLRDYELNMRSAPGGEEGDKVLLSFGANKAQVPDCADWSSGSSFNKENTLSSNFGCAFQRNLGLNVADPGDLVKSKPVSGRPGNRSDRVLESYGSGQATGSKKSSLQPIGND